MKFTVSALILLGRKHNFLNLRLMVLMNVQRGQRRLQKNQSGSVDVVIRWRDMSRAIVLKNDPLDNPLFPRRFISLLN